MVMCCRFVCCKGREVHSVGLSMSTQTKCVLVQVTVRTRVEVQVEVEVRSLHRAADPGCSYCVSTAQHSAALARLWRQVEWSGVEQSLLPSVMGRKSLSSLLVCLRLTFSTRRSCICTGFPCEPAQGTDCVDRRLSVVEMYLMYVFEGMLEVSLDQTRESTRVYTMHDHFSSSDF